MADVFQRSEDTPFSKASQGGNCPHFSSQIADFHLKWSMPMEPPKKPLQEGTNGVVMKIFRPVTILPIRKVALKDGERQI